MSHLRLVGPEGEPPPQLFKPEGVTVTIPPELMQLADRLHDLGFVELSLLLLHTHRKYELVRHAAVKMIETHEPGPGGAA